MQNSVYDAQAAEEGEPDRYYTIPTTGQIEGGRWTHCDLQPILCAISVLHVPQGACSTADCPVPVNLLGRATSVNYEFASSHERRLI